MSRCMLVLLSCVAAVVAFRNTAPLVAWSSNPSSTIGDIQTGSAVLDLADVLQMLPLKDICDHDGIILVDHAGLHASDLQSLSRSATLSQRLRQSRESIQIPRVGIAPSRSLIETLLYEVSTHCGHKPVHGFEGVSKSEVRPDTKYVFHWEMPSLSGSHRERKEHMMQHASLLSDGLDEITKLFPSHFVVLSGSRSSMTKRQVDEPQARSPGPFFDTIQLVPNATSPTTNFLSSYRIFTPGLISALLVVFVIFVPILLVGISALSSIQSPLRMESKPPSAEKKHQ